MFCTVSIQARRLPCESVINYGARKGKNRLKIKKKSHVVPPAWKGGVRAVRWMENDRAFMLLKWKYPLYASASSPRRSGSVKTRKLWFFHPACSRAVTWGGGGGSGNQKEKQTWDLKIPSRYPGDSWEALLSLDCSFSHTPPATSRLKLTPTPKRHPSLRLHCNH